MRKLNCILSYATILVLVLYTSFKLFRYPGAWMIMIVLGILLTIYFPLQILDQVKRSSEGKLFPVHVIGAFCLSVLIISLLFKFQHWAGAGKITLFGLLVFGFLFVPMLFYHQSNKQKANHWINATGSMGLMLIALGFIFRILNFPYQDLLILSGQVLIFGIYFPLYAFTKSIVQPERISYLQNSFNVLILGYLFFLFIYGIVMKWPVIYLDLL
ncbi:MAG TPA: hypothetical protein VGK10_07540 [Prolixibacteraceae bacterium]|jgi:hypothetical protein